MTSWIKVPRKTKSEDGPRIRNYFLRLENTNFAGSFTALFNAYMFSIINTRNLYVYDGANAISSTYSFLQETFEPTESIHYVSEMMPGVTVLTGNSDPRYAGFLTQTPQNTLRSNATPVLRWNQKMLESIMEITKAQELPSKFDVGVHIRSRSRVDMIRPPTVASYVSAIEDALRTQKVKEQNIFVLVSEPTDFIEFQNLAPKSWKLFQISPASSTIRGINTISFNRQSTAVKLNAYKEHIAELYCMQQSTNIIGTLSTDIGKFLYLTAKTPETFKSLDVQIYS
jgi:hypothetical protein